MVCARGGQSPPDLRLHHRHPFPVLLGLIVLIMLTIGAPASSTE